jgi:hypothetical protein
LFLDVILIISGFKLDLQSKPVSVYAVYPFISCYVSGTAETSTTLFEQYIYVIALRPLLGYYCCTHSGRVVLAQHSMPPESPLQKHPGKLFCLQRGEESTVIICQETDSGSGTPFYKKRT